MGIFLKKHLKIAGFTLNEVVITIFIIGILSAIAIPGIIQWMPNMEIKGAARGIYSAMQEAKSIAIYENILTGTAVFFDNTVTPNTYQILRDPGVDGNWGTGGDDTNPAPGPDGIYGNADDIPEDPPMSLPIRVTFNTNATTNATTGGGGFPADFISYNNNIVVFNKQGYLFNAGFTGYVYIANLNTSYAIGTPAVSGRIMLFEWKPASAAWFR